jgi:hypothetical protein
MKLPPRSSIRLTVAVPLFALAGCGIPLSTMHGPVPVPASTSAVTVGLGPIFLGEGIDQDLLEFNLVFSPYANFRHGITERLEAGASIGIFNGITAEAKYRLVPGPIAVSANLGLSAGSIWSIDLWGDNSEWLWNLGAQPALLVGTERIYGGAKLMLFPFNEHVRRPWTVAFAGGSFGGALRFVPEVAWVRDPDDGQEDWILGIGVQLRSNRPLIR